MKRTKEQLKMDKARNTAFNRAEIAYDELIEQINTEFEAVSESLSEALSALSAAHEAALDQAAKDLGLALDEAQRAYAAGASHLTHLLKWDRKHFNISRQEGTGSWIVSRSKYGN